MKRWYYLVLLVCLVFFPVSVFSEVVFSLDFSAPKSVESAAKWLENNGFIFKLDADEFTLKFENSRLIIGNPKDTNGLLYKETEIKNVKRVRIEWSVDTYPVGVDWEKGVTRDAVMVIITFGTEKISSGSLVVPNLPYFIGIFLGEKEKEGKAYIGNYYKKGGRYFCSPCNSEAGKTVVTDFELHDRFRELFNQKTVPPITAIAIESDTRDLGGMSRASIRKIEFLSD